MPVLQLLSGSRVSLQSEPPKYTEAPETTVMATGSRPAGEEAVPGKTVGRFFVLSTCHKFQPVLDFSYGEYSSKDKHQLWSDHDPGEGFGCSAG